MKILNHVLDPVCYLPSANYDQRPQNEPISLLVIHNISLPPGRFGTGYVQRFFQNRLPIDAHPFFKEISSLKVSSHLFIERNGDITQFVPFNLRAWHAGVSKWKGRENCNDFSIGIELEGVDDVSYEEIQYENLANVTTVLMKHYPALSKENIAGHEHISPIRKTDPGIAFDWKHFHKKIDKCLKS